MRIYIHMEGGKKCYSFKKRNVSFEDLIFCIQHGGIVLIDPNTKLGYEHQHTITLLFKDYYRDVHCFIEQEKQIVHLITAYANRIHKRTFTL